MKFLVFQHGIHEDTGMFRAMMARDDIACHTVLLDEGGVIPPLDGFDALWVMGGAMDVWDVVQYPWLIEEKAAIRHWVRALQKPYYGVCLGHQLLADALGGTCGPQKPAEIGVYDIRLTGAGRSDPFLTGMPDLYKSMQWHHVQVAQPPEGARVLATSDACPVQALRIGDHAYSTQYHAEAGAETLVTWAGFPALAEALGATGKARMLTEAEAELVQFQTRAETLYANFMAMMRNRGA